MSTKKFNEMSSIDRLKWGLEEVELRREESRMVYEGLITQDKASDWQDCRRQSIGARKLDVYFMCLVAIRESFSASSEVH